MRRYFLLIGLAVAPLLAVGNAYGTGLTDWNMASLYTKVRPPRRHAHANLNLSLSSKTGSRRRRWPPPSPAACR